MWRRGSLLGLVLIALGSRLGVHLTDRPAVWLPPFIALSGLALFTLAQAKPGVTDSRSLDNLRPATAVLTALAIAGLTLGTICEGWQRALYFGLSGLSLLTLIPGWHTRRCSALLLGFFIMVTCASSTLLLYRFAWCLHDIGLTENAHLSDLLPNVTMADGALNVWTRHGPKTVRITFEALGLYELWYIGVALIAFSVLVRPKGAGRWLALSFAITTGYAFIRFITVTATAIELDMARLLWGSCMSLASWLPLGLLLRLPPLRGDEARLGLFGRVPRKALLALLPTLLTGMMLSFDDPGYLKDGRVVIDETHANWEWTHLPFDTTSVGIHAEYNYRCFYEYVNRHYSVSLCTAGLTEALLDTTDILIIKTPTEPYSPEEIEAIVRFVRCGGGLALIGDHTNLFGMSTYLNEIATRFGMRFRYDDIFDLVTTGLTAFSPSRLSQHPSVRALNRFTFLTSCSIQAPPFIDPIMVGSGLGSEDVDYSHPNFFGNIVFDLCDRFGLLLQAAARRFGEGRILLFTDSTCFSNFCLFDDGKPELVSGMLDYLNRRGRRYWPIRMSVMLASLVALGVLILRYFKSLKPAIVFVIYLTLLLGIYLGRVSSFVLYGQLTLSPEKAVLFDTSHSQATYSDYFGLSDRQGADYTEFFICARRVGLHPVASDLGKLEQSSPLGIVIVEPSRQFSLNEVDALTSYVKQGGRLLILDSAFNRASSANQLLRSFGMGLRLTYQVDEETEGGASIKPVLRVLGGTEITDNGTGCEVRYVQAGGGYVIVAVDGFRFTGTVMGRLLRGRIPPFIMKRYLEASRLLKLALLEIPGHPHSQSTVDAGHQ